MAASCSSASGALPLRTEQGIPENHRKPLSRSRTAEDHDKDQPFAAHLNGRTDLSVNPQVRHPRDWNSSGSPVCTRAGSFDCSGCGFIFCVYLVDAERGTLGDQAVDWWLERFVKILCRAGGVQVLVDDDEALNSIR